MPHRDIFAEIDAPLLLHPVEDAVVLHIGVSPNANLVDVSAYYRIHPHRSVLAQHDVADNLRRFVHVTCRRNRGPNTFIRSNHSLEGN